MVSRLAPCHGQPYENSGADGKRVLGGWREMVEDLVNFMLGGSSEWM